MSAPTAKRPTPREVLAMFADLGVYAMGTDIWNELVRQFPEKRVAFVYRKLLDAGMLECGVTIKHAWLTPRGMAAILPSLDDPKT